jgi:ribonuclease-3
MSLAELENSIGYKFKNKKLLDEAITHKSINSDFNNERLEFLGDSVISLVVSEALHFEESSLDEGKLSIYRSRIVSRSSLSKAGLKIKLDKYLQAGSALKNNQNLTETIIGNTLEALIGAIFLDSDFLKAKEITLSILDIDFSKLLLEEQKDSKTLLQEFLQSLDDDLPEYVTTEKKQNGKIYFVSKVTLPKHNVFGEGQGKSKKLAEQEAASNVLIMLNKDGK